jgi:hypothetical protein
VFTDDKESASASSDGNPIMEIPCGPALRKGDARLGGFTRHRVFGQVRVVCLTRVFRTRRIEWQQRRRGGLVSALSRKDATVRADIYLSFRSPKSEVRTPNVVRVQEFPD